MPDMHARCRWTLVAAALFVAGCSTVAPPRPAPSIVSTEAANFHSAADAPHVADAIRQQLEQSGKTVQDLSASDLNTYAGVLLAAGRLDDADKTLTVLDKKQPGDKETLKTLALLAEARGDASYEARVSALTQKFPTDPEVLNLKAHLLASKGDTAGASAAWSASLAKTETREALEGLAGIALDANKPDEALPLADRALQHDPDDGTWALHSQVMRALNKPFDARHDLDQAVSLAPNDPWHRLDRARVEWRQIHDAAAAQTDLETAVKLDPNNVLSWSLLSEVLESRDQVQPAYDALLKTIQLRADFNPSYPSGAMLAFRLKDYPRAIEFARKAAKDYPGEYAFPLVEFLSLQALNRPQDAQASLDKARPRYTENASVTELFRFLQTPTSDSFLNTTLEKDKNQANRIRVKYYQGCWYAQTGAAASAQAAFEEVAACQLEGIPEILAARAWLNHGN
jgi:tetratricopeptide (TPR) repeat protein